MRRYYFFVAVSNLVIAVLLLAVGIPSRMNEFLILCNALSAAFYYRESSATVTE